MSKQRIAVVGGGMAGMSAAYRLRAAGHEPTVFDRNDRVGGRVRSVQQGGYLMDLGAAVFLGTYRDTIATIRDAGLGAQLRELAASGAIPRNGTLHEFDFAKPIRTALTTKVVSPAAKLRGIKLAVMLLRNLGNLGYDDYDRLATIDTESSRDYSSRALGRELEEYGTEPLVRGTWAADHRESSNALMLWSIKNMFMPTVFSLDSGMDGLARAIAEMITVKLSQPVSNVTAYDDRVEVTSTPSGGAAEEVDTFDGVVIATTAGPALGMFPQMDDNHRALYESARYRGMVTAILGLDRAPTDRLTYILVPEVEDRNYIAVISDHNKAVGRVPAGKSLYTLNSSHEYLHRTWDRSDEGLLDDAIACVTRYHGGDVAGTVEQYRFTRWEEVVPVVDAGRFGQIAHFKKRLDPAARVQFASDLDRVPGVNGAVVSGVEAAARIVAGAPGWTAPVSVAAPSRPHSNGLTRLKAAQQQ